MKHIIFFLLGLLAYAAPALAQTTTIPVEPSLRQQLHHIFAPLDKSQTATSLFFDQALPLLAPSRYRGAITDSNSLDINIFGMLYGEFRNSRTVAGNSLLPSPTVYLDKIHQSQGDTVPLVLLALRFDRFIPDAQDRGLVSYSNGQYHDVMPRPYPPYTEDTVFAASLLRNQVNTLSPVLTFPNDLGIQNLGWSLDSLEVDADDGLGWRSLPPSGSITAAYAEPGQKDVRIRCWANGAYWYAHTPLEVSEPPAQQKFAHYNDTPDETMTITGIKPYLGGFASAKVQFFYHCGAKKLRKPLIVVEGFEFQGFVYNDYQRLLNTLDIPLWTDNPINLREYFTDEGYDVVYVDFNNNVDYIQRNAFLLEEVIRVVNQKKAAALSNEQNVVLGVSLGGVIGKYALLDMQVSSLPHDTRLLITYDSPLRGANIPIGIQSMIRFLKFNLDELAESQGTTAFSIPILNDALNVLNSPAPRQLLLQQAEYVGTEVVLVPPPPPPIPPVITQWDFVVSNAPQAAFVAELDGLGSLAIRHVAIASGAANGTFLENDYGAGGLMYTMDLTGHICEEFFIKVLGWQVTGCANIDLEMAVRATGNNTPTEVFKGGFKFDKVGSPNGTLGHDLSVVLTTPPFDVMPGGNSALGIGGLVGLDVGLKDLVGDYPSLTLTTSWPATIRPIHHTFVPTFSSLSAAMPSNAAAPQACGTPTLCSVPTEPLPNPITLRATPPTAPPPTNEWNQEHIFLEARVGNLLKQELNALPSTYPHGQLSTTLSTYYNLGDPAYRKVSSLSIETASGKLSVNNQGRVGYATGNEPFSPLAMYHAYTECDAVINVESGSTLAVGGDQVGRDAVFHIEGSTVHIKPGGRLVVHGNSVLSIENGSQIILETGSILILRDNPDGPLVENGRPRIKIESGGKLVAKGDITILGDGYLEFDKGNIAELPENFTLTGAGKAYRFVRVNNGAEFKKKGGNFTLQDGLAEVGTLGRVLHEDGGISRGLRTAFRPISGAVMPHTGFEVINGGTVQIQYSEVKDLKYGVLVTNAAGSVTALSSHFENTLGIDVWGANFASMNTVTGAKASFRYNGVPTSVNLLNCTLDGHYSEEAILTLTYVRMMTMTGGVMDAQFEGHCIDATANGNNLTLRNGATLKNGNYGIHVNGGLFGGPNAYNYGLVTMDCARILDCTFACIAGQDALLNIDADINSSSLRPNEFRLQAGAEGLSKYFDICYVKRNPGASIRARRNFWNKFDLMGNSTGPAPDEYVLVRSATALGCGVGNLVPLISAPAAAAYNSACPIDGYTGGKPAPGSPIYSRRALSQGLQNRLPSDKDCSMSGTDLYSNSASAWVALNTAFDQSEAADAEPNLSAALALFTPVANFDSAQLVSVTDVCRQYVNVAQIFVLPTGANQQRAEERSSASLLASQPSLLPIAPNPANGSFTVTLPDSPCTLRVWDALGRLAHEVSNASGLTVVDAGGWAAGLYLVEMTSVEGKSWGKVVVER